MPDDDQTLPADPSALLKAKAMAHGVPSIRGYRMDKKLGEGTFGEVWLAYADHTGVAVAIKIFKHGAGQQWHALQEEVRSLAKVSADHGIVRLIDADYQAQPPFYVMDFLEKGSLAQRLSQGSLTVAEALEFFRRVAEALAYMHEKGICHCDLKPANILLDSRDQPRIADFGQAHLSTDTSAALGTFFYMAPEQATTESTVPDPRWDVYALGALFYAMVTGRPPREDGQLRQELSATSAFAHRLKLYRERIHAAPKPVAHRRVAGMDRQLAEIIDCCLTIDPTRRFRSAKDVVKALDLREQLRKQRTMMRFGFIAPFFILGIMGVLAFHTGRDAMKDAELKMIEQVSQSDLAAAKLVARIVDEQLTDQLDVVKRESEGYALISALVGQSESDLLESRLRFTNIIKEISLRNGQEKFRRWTLASARGVSVANWPPSPNQQSNASPSANSLPQFSWRGWFNGEKDYYERTNEFFPPLRMAYISQPFVGRLNDKLEVIALSSPIIDTNNPQIVLGVLQASTLLENLHGWLRSAELSGAIPVLVNGRLQIVQHPDPNNPSMNLKPHPREDPKSFPDCPAFRLAVETNGVITYSNPVDGKTYLAGYAPAYKTGWGALVQHEVSVAQRPLNELKQRIRDAGWLVVSIPAILLALQWLVLRRVLRLKQHWLYGLLGRSR